MKRLVRLALTLPPRVVVRRAAGMLRDRALAAIGRRRDNHRPTFAVRAPGPLAQRLSRLPAELLEPHRTWVLVLAERFRSHQFDLLGSGWVQVCHGMDCAGLEGHRFHSGIAITADPAGDWLAGRINRANLAESRRLWALVDAGYRPIDWHLDFKSGYRWSEATWYRDVPYGHKPGVDIKVPWELGRLQHLPVLAWAHALAPADGHEREFRNQVLDFLATNPPRFGVNWRCTMDVAIRAANLAVSWDLFAAAGATFDQPFADAVSRSLLEHARHIVDNLEWFAEGRGNHYLANVGGLAAAAAWLPRSPETDRMLAFAAQEVLAETALQFLPDGGNFEASVPYHRLSAEIVAFATAILAGLPVDKRMALEGYDHSGWPARVRLSPGPLHETVPAAHLQRLAAMAAFTAGLTKPSGLLPQIGDNDSGRFLKLQPSLTADWREEDLDHRHLLDAVGALTGEASPRASLDAWVIAGLAGSLRAPPAPQPRPWPQSPIEATTDLGPSRRTILIQPGGGDLRAGLQCSAWPDFGLWLLRSERIYLLLRAGPIGQNGRGGHAHNDQLAIELCLDGEDWLIDPGSYLYTALPARRNQYRAAAAHAVPHWPGKEAGRLDLGLFWLGDNAKGRCLHFDDAGFVGEHDGYGRPVRRRVWVEADRIVIVDSGLAGSEDTATCRTRDEVLAALGSVVPFSPGYGRIEGAAA